MDAEGYVADCNNNRIAVFAPSRFGHSIYYRVTDSNCSPVLGSSRVARPLDGRIHIAGPYFIAGATHDT